MGDNTSERHANGFNGPLVTTPVKDLGVDLQAKSEDGRKGVVINGGDYRCRQVTTGLRRKDWKQRLEFKHINSISTEFNILFLNSQNS